MIKNKKINATDLVIHIENAEVCVWVMAPIPTIQILLLQLEQ